MYAFNYAKPDAVADAERQLRDLDDPKLLAGGQTLIPTMKQRLAMPSDLIDIADIADLKGIAVEGDRLVVGAAEKHADVAASETVRGAIPALAHLASGIGDPHVRHRGTMGGSLANNDPSADYPSAALGLGADIVTSKRTIAADDFFLGMFETALEPDEIILRVSYPKPEKAGYAKFPNPASRYALVGVFVAKTAGGVRVAVTGAGSSVFRAAAIEAALASDFSASAIADGSVPADDLLTDLHAEADYRAAVTVEMARRAAEAANAAV